VGENLAGQVLNFWFGETESPERRDIWFKSTPQFDEEIRSGFLTAHEAAGRGELDGMAETPEGLLALIILLDQFPRNLFRGTARAFATDPMALILARRARGLNLGAGLGKWHRLFLRLPFVHSENAEDQDIGVALAHALDEERSLNSAIEHRDLIRRFGRFPHRNEALGRDNTKDEEEYLGTSPKTFGQGGEEEK
jgi:uncharacterized protein (DUF924 family)